MERRGLKMPRGHREREKKDEWGVRKRARGSGRWIDDEPHKERHQGPVEGIERGVSCGGGAGAHLRAPGLEGGGVGHVPAVGHDPPLVLAARAGWRGRRGRWRAGGVVGGARRQAAEAGGSLGAGKINAKPRDGSGFFLNASWRWQFDTLITSRREGRALVRDRTQNSVVLILECFFEPRKGCEFKFPYLFRLGPKMEVIMQVRVRRRR